MSSRQRRGSVAKKTAGQAGCQSEVLRVHLLREHVPAEGDAALQGDRGEIGALSAFRFRPGAHRRNDPSNRRAQEIQEAKISVDRLDAVAVFRAFRTELQKLHDTFEIIAGSESLDPRNVLYFGRQNLLRGGSDERAAIGDVILRYGRRRENENDAGHHRGTTTRREGARRASAGTRQ